MSCHLNTKVEQDFEIKDITYFLDLVALDILLAAVFDLKGISSHPKFISKHQLNLKNFFSLVFFIVFLNENIDY